MTWDEYYNMDEGTYMTEEAEEYDAPEDNYTDVEADADTLASCGWGTDEDYGYYGDGEDSFADYYGDEW